MSKVSGRRSRSNSVISVSSTDTDSPYSGYLAEEQQLKRQGVSWWKQQQHGEEEEEEEAEGDPDIEFIGLNVPPQWPKDATDRARKDELIRQEDFSKVFEALRERVGGYDILESPEVMKGSSGLISRNQLNTYDEEEEVKRRAQRGQTTAQYGRSKEALVAWLIELTGLSIYDVFVDIGSGIAQVLVQISATVGCISVGIELLERRHAAARHLAESMAAFGEHTGCLWGHINIEHGDFTDETFRKTITTSDVIFCNNALDTFGSRAGTQGMLTLNASLAALFASMAKGARMVTLEDVPDLDKYIGTGALDKDSYTKTGDFVSWNGNKLSELTLFVYTKRSYKKRCHALKCGKSNRLHFDLDKHGRLFLDEFPCGCGARLRYKRMKMQKQSYASEESGEEDSEEEEGEEEGSEDEESDGEESEEEANEEWESDSD